MVKTLGLLCLCPLVLMPVLLAQRATPTWHRHNVQGNQLFDSGGCSGSLVPAVCLAFLPFHPVRNKPTSSKSVIIPHPFIFDSEAQ